MVVVFSDLHLSPKTLNTCLAVLRRVHAEAARRKCPVYFLGDFFDTVYNKGTLPRRRAQYSVALLFKRMDRADEDARGQSRHV